MIPDKKLKTPKHLRKRKQSSDSSESAKSVGKRPKSVSKNTSFEESDPNVTPSYPVEVAAVEAAVAALVKLEASHSKKNTLFKDEAKSILLQVCCIRIPQTPVRRLRFCLPHSLITSTTEVCLFVADLQKGKKEDHDPTVQHYKEFLQTKGICEITQVIPVRQVKVEYDQYELKRQLCNQFSIFLADARICGHVNHLLGKACFKKRKFPTPVKMNSKDLKKEINVALSKAVMNLHGNGDTFNVMVAHSMQSIQQIAENILTVTTGLTKNFPGGWDNVRALYIKTTKSLAVPLYMTFKPSNTVEVPIVKPRRPKAAIPVEGELSTVLGASVTVYPSGEVVVHKDVEDPEWSDFSDVEEEIKKHKKEKKIKKNSSGDKVNVKTSMEEGYKEDEVEPAEDAYLHSWQKGRDARTPVKHKKVKKTKKNTSGDKMNAKTSMEEGYEEDEVEAAEDAYLYSWQKERDARTPEKVSKGKPEEELPRPKKKKLKSTDTNKSKGKSVQKNNLKKKKSRQVIVKERKTAKC